MGVVVGYLQQDAVLEELPPTRHTGEGCRRERPRAGRQRQLTDHRPRQLRRLAGKVQVQAAQQRRTLDDVGGGGGVAAQVIHELFRPLPPRAIAAARCSASRVRCGVFRGALAGTSAGGTIDVLGVEFGTVLQTAVSCCDGEIVSTQLGCDCGVCRRIHSAAVIPAVVLVVGPTPCRITNVVNAPSIIPLTRRRHCVPTQRTSRLALAVVVPDIFKSVLPSTPPVSEVTRCVVQTIRATRPCAARWFVFPEAGLQHQPSLALRRPRLGLERMPRVKRHRQAFL